jgi:hypothetical protein
VRSVIADWERGDWSSNAWADSAIEYVIADGPAPRRGRRSRVASGTSRWARRETRVGSVDDDAIRALVTRLARPHPSGGDVIERAAILAEGADLAAVMAWITAHGRETRGEGCRSPQARPARPARRQRGSRTPDAASLRAAGWCAGLRLVDGLGGEQQPSAPPTTRTPTGVTRAREALAPR